jgi:thiamine biosynthesis lipoprotein
MGTVFSFDIREPGVEQGVLDEAVATLHDIDARYSPYRADSAVSRIASGELAAAEADDEMRQVLADCEDWQQRTEGWFSAYATGVFDPSGYVKGWAIQRASDVLRRAGSTNHCVNGGGDVQCAGASTSTEPWRVGIVDPRNRSNLITVVAGIDIAVATSGTAERGEHIVDPHTGGPPASALLSLTVSGHSIVECDVYATAGFAMGKAARGWLDERGIAAIGVETDGKTWSTGGAPGARVT